MFGEERWIIFVFVRKLKKTLMVLELIIYIFHSIIRDEFYNLFLRPNELVRNYQ